jgi:uncharacterized protein (TIGR00303 family)
MIRVYTQQSQGEAWLARYQGSLPLFACILGFTETGLLPGISAAGATPQARRYTAIADAEFLANGPIPEPYHPLPPLNQGISPVFISRAVLEAHAIPLLIFNAGLPDPPFVPFIELGGQPAQCLSTGAAMTLERVTDLFHQGLSWGSKLAAQAAPGYLILAECVVGGTTTALAILTGLGLSAAGKVNSSHPVCNHAQKWLLVQRGLAQLQVRGRASPSPSSDPFQVVAAVGDPMQIVVAGMAIAASRDCGVLLAGGTQMLAVYALAQALSTHLKLSWQPEQVVVGTTRWVVEDPSADTVGLAQLVGSVPMMATQLDLSLSDYPQLRAYEQGYVKEGVGAGGCAIAAHLYRGWQQQQLVEVIDALVTRYRHIQSKNKT